MKYIILSAETIDELIKQVNAELTNGFIPVGGVAYELKMNGFFCYYQAMLKTL